MWHGWIMIGLSCTELYPRVKQSAGWAISSYLQMNLPVSQEPIHLLSLLTIALFLSCNCFSCCFDSCFSFAFPWLLPHSLPLAPQCHCSPLYLSCLISPSSPPFHSPRLRFLFILTPTSPPPASLPPNTHAHKGTHAHTQSDPFLTSPMSTLLSSCPRSSFLSGSISAWIQSLMGPHNFGQAQFFSADKRRCGTALQMNLRDYRWHDRLIYTFPKAFCF